MKLKKIVLATAIAGAMGGLYGCGSNGDKVEINISDSSSVTTNNTTTSTADTTTSTVVSSCPTFSTKAYNQVNGVNVCQLPSTILEDQTLTNDTIWKMAGTVTVGNGNVEIDANTVVTPVTLTIQQGTEVQGLTGTFAAMIVTRGSKLVAKGTAAAPIIFSSDDEGYDGSNEWGGLVLHGYAPHNKCADAGTYCNIDAEGESGFAGGYDATDSSGTLEYVVVTEGGYEFSAGNELNGISFVAVGNGTTVDHVQVNANSDDGIELFGGTVNIKHLVITAAEDDSIDWDEGYTGNIQYALIKQGSVGDKSIEADTFGTSLFLSKPTIANATFLGKGTASGMLNFKEGSGAFVHNSIAVPQTGATNIADCVLVKGADAIAEITNGNLAVNNFISGCTNFAMDTSSPQVDLSADFGTATVFAVDPAIDGAYAATAADASGVALDLNATAANAAAGTNPNDRGSFFDATDYLGAVAPGTAAADAWWYGWTLEGTL